MERTPTFHMGMSLEEIHRKNEEVDKEIAESASAISEGLKELSTKIKEDQADWKDVMNSMQKMRRQPEYLGPLKKLADDVCGFFLAWLPSY